MTKENLLERQAQLRIELIDLENLDKWSSDEIEEYLKLKTEYFKVLNQLEKME